MRSHGSGGACYKSRTSPACEECRAYRRAVEHRLVRTPGTSRYNAAHNIGIAGQRERNKQNRWLRGRADANDLAALAAIDWKGLVNA